MRKQILMTLLLFMFFGCAANSPGYDNNTYPLEVALALKPIKAPELGRCPAPQLTAFPIGNGNSHLLGPVDAHFSHCIDPTGETKNDLAFNDGLGFFSMTTGEELHLSYAGILIPTEKKHLYLVELIFYITGGTGCFQEASGGGKGEGKADYSESESNVLRLKGTITLSSSQNCGKNAS